MAEIQLETNHHVNPFSLSLLAKIPALKKLKLAFLPPFSGRILFNFLNTS